MVNFFLRLIEWWCAPEETLTEHKKRAWGAFAKRMKEGR